jgi:hypothetical protein
MESISDKPHEEVLVGRVMDDDEDVPDELYFDEEASGARTYFSLDPEDLIGHIFVYRFAEGQVFRNGDSFTVELPPSLTE